jgi:capsular exopolysaccharide synthesis family protein
MSEVPAVRYEPDPSEYSSDELSSGAPFIIGLWKQLWRHKLLIVTITSVGLLGSVAFKLLVPPRYTSKAVLEIDNRRSQWNNTISPVSELPEDRNAMWGVIWGEVAKLNAWPLAAHLVDQLGLIHDPEFNRSRRRETFEQGLARTGLTQVAPSASVSTAEAERMGVVAALQKKILVTADRNTGLIHLKVTVNDPTKARAIAQQLIDNYLEDQIGRKNAEIARAVTWLQDQIATLQSDVIKTNTAVENYRVKAHLLDIHGTAGQSGTLAARQVSDLNKSLIDAMGELTGVTSRLKEARTAISDPTKLDHSPDAMNSRVIQELRIKDSAFAGEIAGITQKYGANHPQLQTAQAARNAVQREIKNELGRIATSILVQENSAAAKVKLIEERLQAAYHDLEKQAHDSVQLNQLQFAASTAREVFTAFLLKLRQLTADLEIQKPDTVVIEPPRLMYGATFPSPLIIPAGALVSMIFAAVLVLLIENAETSFRTQNDLEQRLKVRSVGIIPQTSSRSHVMTVEMLYAIRTNLLACLPGWPTTLLVTSAVQDEGKTTTALALARVAASADQKVLLINGDLARPSLHSKLGLSNQNGLGDVLEQRASLQECIVTDASGISVMVAGVTTQHPVSLLASQRMVNLLEEVKQTYDAVIIDSPPLLAVADATVLARVVDCTLLAVRWHHTPMRSVMRALKLLPDEPLCVLTRVDMRKYENGDRRYYRNYRSSSPLTQHEICGAYEKS